MHTATLGDNHQLTLPEAFCQEVNLCPGQRFTLIVKGRIIELVPIPTLQALRGAFKGANAEGYRDRTDRY